MTLRWLSGFALLMVLMSIFAPVSRADWDDHRWGGRPYWGGGYSRPWGGWGGPGYGGNRGWGGGFYGNRGGWGGGCHRPGPRWW